MTRKPIKRFLPLTYKPKIPGVLAGEINQSIRVDHEETKRDLQVGDHVAFHGWSGRPYHSPWSFRTPFCKVIEAHPISVRKDSIYFSEEKLILKSDDPVLDKLAALDGIEPPTGRELIRVLHLMHGFGTLKGKVLRWDPEPMIKIISSIESQSIAPFVIKPDPSQIDELGRIKMTKEQFGPLHAPRLTPPQHDFVQIGDIERLRGKQGAQ